MSSDTTNSSSIPRNSSSGIEAHTNELIIPNGETGYYSSPPSSPGPDDSGPSFFFQQEKQLSLGVYFSADEGENNDVIAALRAGQRVIKETAELLMEYRPRTEQNSALAATLHTQDREFTQWIYSGLGIDASRRLSIRSLSLYEKLAKYINLLQDLEGYLPYTAPSKVGSLLRRLSTSGPYPHPSSDNHASKVVENPRLAMLAMKIEKRFEELKEGVTALRNTERKRKASWDIAQRTRKDLKISHDLCLPETRVDLLAAITSWIKSDSNEHGGRVFCIIGGESSGKSAVAATLAVEWKRAGILEREIFLTKGVPDSSPPRRRTTGDGNGTHPSALSRALSKFRRNSSRPAVARDLPSALLAGVVNSTSSSMKEGGGKVVLVDGLDHVPEEERQKIVGTLKEILEKRPEIKIVVTARTDSAEWIKTIEEASTRVVKQEIPSGADPVNLNDMATYVSSRLSLLLTVADQQRVIDAAEGNWGDLVRLCTQVEEYGNPERALDIVLYNQLVKKHGDGHVKVVVV